MDMSIRFPYLGIDLDYVPKAFSIYGFEITIYGLLIAAGMLLGVALVVLEAKRSNQNQDLYLGAGILGLLGGLVGARLYYVAFSWDLYKADPMEILNIRSGGMAIYGGILGGVLAVSLFCRLRKLSFGEMADIFSMGLLLAQIIGKWGSFFNRESFGGYTDWPTAMQLPLSSVRAGEVTAFLAEHVQAADGITYIQVHPLFLYESLWCLLLFFYLLASRRRRLFSGEIFMKYLAGYGFGRFFLEWLRTDQLLIPGTRIPVSMAVSAFLFLYFSVSVLIRRSMEKKRAEARRRRREEFYEAEEQAAREQDAEEAAGEDPASPEKTGPQGTQPGDAASESPAQPEDGQTDLQVSEKIASAESGTDQMKEEDSIFTADAPDGQKMPAFPENLAENAGDEGSGDDARAEGSGDAVPAEGSGDAARAEESGDAVPAERISPSDPESSEEKVETAAE